jgi:excinuclease ABC subunit C
MTTGEIMEEEPGTMGSGGEPVTTGAPDERRGQET